jgi:hypothetical protein
MKSTKRQTEQIYTNRNTFQHTFSVTLYLIISVSASYSLRLSERCQFNPGEGLDSPTVTYPFDFSDVPQRYHSLTPNYWIQSLNSRAVIQRADARSISASVAAIQKTIDPITCGAR